MTLTIISILRMAAAVALLPLAALARLGAQTLPLSPSGDLCITSCGR